MEQFWHFMYFLAGGIFTTFMTKYICAAIIAIKTGKKPKLEDDEEY